MQLHIDSAAAKAHSLRLQAEALLGSRITAQFDLSAGTQHAMPGYIERIAQAARNLTRPVRESNRSAHRSVGRDLPARNQSDGGQNFCAHGGTGLDKRARSADEGVRATLNLCGYALAE
jgi:hypothetical protein